MFLILQEAAFQETSVKIACGFI